MAVITIEELQGQLNLPADMDSDILADKILAAQNHIERLLGYRIEDNFGGQDQPDIPPALVEAVKQLASWWYVQRETAITGTIVAQVPFGVAEIVAEYREWSF